MKKRTIRLTVENEYVRGAGVPVGAAGSHDEVELEVTFVGDVWIGTNKYVTFRDSLGQSPRHRMLLDAESVSGLSENGETYKVSIPCAAKMHAGNMSVTFTGYTLDTQTIEGVTTTYEDVCVTTTVAYFRVLPSDYAILEDGSFESEQGATLAQQCQSAANSVYQNAENAKTAAVEAKSAAETATERANEAGASATATAALVGNIETAIDEILKIQNSLMGGDTE